MTDDLAPELLELDAFLNSVPLEAEAMNVSELDGYFAGLLVCPELIAPDEWLTPIFGEADLAALFPGTAEFKRVFELVLFAYNEVAGGLMEGTYDPLLLHDKAADEFVWECWAEGFGKAMALGWEAFANLSSRSEEAKTCLTMMMALVDSATRTGPSKLGEEAEAELIAAAPGIIEECIWSLHALRLAEPPVSARPGPVRKGPTAGRNDPCPCGSGRKYKKCCGAN